MMIKVGISISSVVSSRKTIPRCGNIRLGVLVDLSIGNMRSGVANYPCQSYRQNAHLWFDGFGRLAGFAISENGGHEVAIIGLRFKNVRIV
jgi:hypothetical protein